MRAELKEVEDLLNEIEVHEQYKRALVDSLRRIDRDYQRGLFGYVEYESRRKAALRGRSEEEWVRYYNSYIYSLLKRVEHSLSKVFYSVYEASSAEERKAASHPLQAASSVPEVGSLKLEAKPAASHGEPQAKKVGDIVAFDDELARLKARVEAPVEHPAAPVTVVAPAARIKVPSVPTVGELAIPEIRMRSVVEAPVEPVQSSVSVRLPAAAPKPHEARKLSFGFPKLRLPSLSFSLPKVGFGWVLSFFRRKPAVGLVKQSGLQAAGRKPQAERKASVFSGIPYVSGLFKDVKSGAVFDRIFSGVRPEEHRTVFAEEIVKMEKNPLAEKEVQKPVSGAGITFSAIPGRKLISDIMARFEAKQEGVIGERIEIPMHIRRLREMRKKIYNSELLAGFDSTLLAQEAKRIRKILEAERPDVYQGSSIGLIANVTVKKISLYLVDSFPEVFGYLYNALRAANVKILSNTYVNIMILCALVISALISVLMLFLLFALNHPLYEVLLRSVLFGVFAGILCAVFFYAYPFIRIKERRRNVTTNLPFAINHIASVSASGVPPARMFELISTSSEYGEIAVEIMKIVDFINVFGYDILTAIRSVASTTPSPVFKEFLEGMVSVVETGGDLSSYLRQKADEASLNYELERKKYNETVSIYSDIYTGIVIAAPLLFMSALSMVNLLGGTLGGMGVDVVMALGAYIVIPMLNIGFLVFLQVNQPEI